MSKHLRELIQQQKPGMSVRGFERAAGLSQGKVRQWEKPGAHMPKKQLVIRMAQALDCTPGQVFEAILHDIGHGVEEYRADLEQHIRTGVLQALYDEVLQECGIETLRLLTARTSLREIAGPARDHHEGRPEAGS